MIPDRRKMIRVSFAIVGIGALSGLLIGIGWALWGDVKGQRSMCCFLGLGMGVLFGVPVVLVYILERTVEKLWQKCTITLVPLLIFSFCVPFYGGAVMFLQLVAILVPSFLVKRWWTTLFVSLGGGFLFLWVWYVLRSNGMAPLNRSDDIFVFYPFAIGLLGIDLAVAKAIGPRGQRP